ncbi:hypothetical protein SBRCBS47491_004603 [Sporothrix bragantina]|uniref:Ubiquitin-conjugating enzyme E2C-binding protein n=1 Tax=Sporothrix bragantina TaxID=671064 RepID=A0ABP0BQ55_9PEZI
MPTPPVQLYAELLANIRQVSVSALFAVPVNAATTTAVILPDGETLRIQQDGQTLATMTLPGKVAVSVAGGGPKSLPMLGPVLVSGNVTWRLPAVDGLNKTQDDNDCLAPWSAPDLPPKSPVACRACETELVAASTVQTWKDLPSDNWAEMMEFWHCHKPDVKEETKKSIKGGDKDGEKDENENRLADRGYGANSVISAERGVGFVDLTTLLFAEDDCQNFLFSTSTADKASANRETLLSSTSADLRGLHIYCSSCRAQVGYLTLRRQQSVHLFKWQVAVVGAESTAPSIADCVAATLVATIQRTGSSKSFLLPIYELDGGEGATDREEEKGDEKALQVWVLNSSIGYAAWPAETPSGPAIKLLYRFVPRKEADDTLDRLNSDVQEINLPRETIAAVTGLLEESNNLLPPRDRLFQEWKIGLLKRWRR